MEIPTDGGYMCLSEKDIAGKKFNSLTAIQRDKSIKGKNYWEFKCDCGLIKSILKYDVINGKTISCGCINGGYLKRLEKIKSDMIGKKFNKLLIEEFAYVKQGNSYWKCLCDCGKEVIVPRHALKSNNTTSCGCAKIYNNKKGEIGLKRLYSQYKSQAVKNDREFNISIEEFKRLTSSTCTYCGSSPVSVIMIRVNKNKEVQEFSKYLYNGLDRVDSSKDYNLDNVVPCCKWCNIAKRDRSVEDFLNHISNIYQYSLRNKKYA